MSISKKSRRNLPDDRSAGRVMSVEQALHYLHQHHLPLHYDDRVDGDVWSTKKLPIALRRTIFKHRRQLLDLMQQGDAMAWPTPLHHHYWRYDQDRCVCLMCQRLEPSIQATSSYVVAA